MEEDAIDLNALETESLAMPSEWTIAAPQYDGQAEAVAGTLDLLLRVLASHGSDLRSLDGITLAADCKAAAAELQKWPDGEGPTYRTERGQTIEMARTVAVWRGKELRFHIVLQEAIGRLMLSEEREDQVLALSCLAHEAAHVEHEGNLFRACPHIFWGPLPRGDKSVPVFLTVMDTWSEYSACRSSAFFRPASARGFDELFDEAIQAASKAKDATDQIPLPLEKSGEGKSPGQQLMGALFIYAGYLFGHIDGLLVSAELEELRAMENLKKWPDIHRVFLRLHEELRQLWLSECSWKDINVFFPLYDLLEELNGFNKVCWRLSAR